MNRDPKGGHRCLAADGAWVADAQVEQDLIISRVLVTLYKDQYLADRLAFRGGTALHKLYFRPPRRYSEDIDLVQVVPEPIGIIFDTVQKVINPFLGAPRRKQAADAVTLMYRIESEGPPVIQSRSSLFRQHPAFFKWFAAPSLIPHP